MTEEWRDLLLGDVLTLQRGFDLPSHERRPGTYPVISSGGHHGYHSEAMVSGPTVVTGRYGTIGEVFYIEGPSWPLNTTLWVKDFKGNDPLFTAYLLRSIPFRRYSDKTGVTGVNRNDLHRVRVKLPPLGEQRRIACVLSTWERGIEQVTKLIKAKRRLKRSLMQQLLTGERRFGNFEGQPWREYHLSDVFAERNEMGRSDLPLLAITADRGVIPREEVERKDTSNADKRLYKRITPGDIGYNTMRMWQGVSAVSSLEGIVSPAYTVCIPLKEVYAPFMGYLFKFPPVVHLFRRYSQGLVDDTLNLKFHEFAQIKVELPPVTEQKRIAEVLSTVDREIELLHQFLGILKEQKKGLMQKLLTGQVRVPETMAQAPAES